MARKKQQAEEEMEVEMSSGNVFADLGIENPEEELNKAKLAWEFSKRLIIEQKSTLKGGRYLQVT